MVAATQKLRRSTTASEDRGVSLNDTPTAEGLDDADRPRRTGRVSRTVSPRHDGSTLAPCRGSKNFEFLKIQDGAGAILKITKARYLRNGLTDLYEIWYGCAICVSTAQTVKIIEFQISKMADSCYSENRYITIYLQSFDRF